jgi:hypothetical protein
VLCPAVWDVCASSYEWRWHEIGRYVAHVRPELLFWHCSSGVPRNSVRGVQQIQLRTEGRDKGDLGAVAP